MRIEQVNLVEFWLFEAKLLHKHVKSERKSHSLPVLRRLLNQKVLVGLSLPELQKDVSIVQRKHLLQLVSIENGFASWVAFKQTLESASDSSGQYLPERIKLKNIGYPALWFSTMDEAVSYANIHGGEAIPVGSQAVIAINHSA
ncbi:hypothetical protein [Vibrio tapetis]|uniref:Uncharacterized protein n=1 Tax=Vibrio tapetis subsp. tapetis TaxID=1671868 RepID=A0A2N8ZDL3_9VIBR|nr:hypothetical protein [Vibrio tapetis]SON49996.1 conserved protein of unknown function [Vibrio tapetis subsp. tapetis]